MALLEPALTETLTNGCIAVIREGMERVVAAGVPEEATRTFLMGHLQIGIALIFEQFDWRLSEGAQLALDPVPRAAVQGRLAPDLRARRRDGRV